jgi:glycosyltransferase involved in cell wall biosynthesis
MNNKKILILFNDIKIYNLRRELIDELINQKFDIYVSMPYEENIPQIINKECHYVDVKIARRSKNFIKDLDLLNQYQKMIKAIEPALVLSYTIKPNIYGSLAAQSLKIPYIANITGLGEIFAKDGFTKRMILLLYRMAFKNVNCVFFQNKEDQQLFIEEQIAINSHRLIPGSGVNVDEFSLLPYPSEPPINFIYISRIMKTKGIEEYIEAAKYIKSKYPLTNFHICGSFVEKYQPIVEQLVADNFVHYHGLVDDIRPLLTDIHCTIHPSYYREGISNVLLESAASGRPIITTNHSGCKEVVDEGKTGFLFKKQDKQDLIEKIEAFIALSYDEKKEMGEKGRIKVTEQFNRKIVVEAYIQEINKIVNNN